MGKAKSLVLIALQLWWVTATAGPVVDSIQYKGNYTTDVSVMNREIFIQPGKVLDIEQLEKSRQAIMNLGLFKSVKVFVKKNENQNFSSEVESHVDIVFQLEEKYYLLLIPRIKSEDDELYLGLQLRWDNVWGMNHQMRILVEDRGATQGIDEHRNEFRYDYPNIAGTPYNLGLRATVVNEVDETDELVDRQDEVVSFSVTRWVNALGRNRGWFVGGRLLYQERLNETLLESENSESINAYVLGVNVGFRNIDRFDYNRGGKDYGYILDWSDDRIGSEAEFTRHQIYYRSYYRFHAYPLSNLNVQTRLGHSNNSILGDTAFSLGSSDDLRGYENNRFEGNTVLLTNVEYMFPQQGYPLIRYVSFVDMGNTYDSLKNIFHRPLNVGAGVGLRWKVRAFVKLDLRADLGYGFTDSDYKFSFGTRHAF